jgi:excisionase family DNA binding protein
MDAHDRSEAQLLTVPDAAKRLALGLSLTYRLVLEGQLRSVKIGRCRRVPAYEIEAFISRQLAADNEP